MRPLREWTGGAEWDAREAAAAAQASAGSSLRATLDRVIAAMEAPAVAVQGGGDTQPVLDAGGRGDTAPNTAPPALDPNRPFVIDQRYYDALRRVRATLPRYGSADVPVPSMPDGEYQPGLGFLMLRIATARLEDLPQLHADINALYMQPGAHRTGEALIRAMDDAAEAGGNLQERREILKRIAPIAKSDPLRLAADEFGSPGAMLVEGAAGAGTRAIEGEESAAANSGNVKNDIKASSSFEARLQAIQQTKTLYGLRSDLGTEWFDGQGKLFWPPNEGASGAWQTTTLQPGTMIDRYGTAGGSYFFQGERHLRRGLYPRIPNRLSIMPIACSSRSTFGVHK